MMMHQVYLPPFCANFRLVVYSIYLLSLPLPSHCIFELLYGIICLQYEQLTLTAYYYY